MHPQIEQSLLIEFDQLFSLGDRVGMVADQVRARLLAMGLTEPLETEVFDDELELRGTHLTQLLIRLDSYHLEIVGAPPELQTHRVAAIILDEAGAFRLATVEAGFSLTASPPKGQDLDLVERAFQPLDETGQALDRRFSMTWDWGTATTGYSLSGTLTEDREAAVLFKAREGYMTLPELESGVWMAEQSQRFDGAVDRFFSHLGWKP